MGVNNRAKRAAKAKQRSKQRAREQHSDQSHFSGDKPWDAVDPVAEAIADLESLIRVRIDQREAPSHLAGFLRNSARHQQQAIDALLDDMLVNLFAGGWSPDDLYETTRRRASVALADYALRVVATLTRSYAPDRVAPAWLARLDGIPDSSGCRSWAQEQQIIWDDARAAMLDLLTSMGSLPGIQPIMPAPGSWKPVDSGARSVDDRILSKVRGLLAKAESTDFDEEAEALTAKAQDLMKTYAIEQALVTEEAGEKRERPELRRVWIEAPYVEPKATLIHTVAASNRCRCVYDATLSFVTVIGFAADLDTVELLSTSLLFQASRSMRAEGTRRYRDGGSRTRSFRQSFLLAYAIRIGERLREAAAETESRVNTAHDGRLLPVLAARDNDVTDYAQDIFPNLTHKSINIPDHEGYGAGRVAADKAHIEVRDAIEEM